MFNQIFILKINLSFRNIHCLCFIFSLNYKTYKFYVFFFIQRSSNLIKLTMANNDQMPKVDFQKDGEIDKRLLQQIKFVERQNLVRATRLNRMRKNARYTGLILGSISLSIYVYSIYSIKQETFLDDFEEPKVTLKQ